MKNFSLSKKLAAACLLASMTPLAFAGGTFTTVYSFSGTDGMLPTSLMQAADGKLYGATLTGGIGYVPDSAVTGFGTIYSLTTDGVFSGVYQFQNGNDGMQPLAALVQTQDGSLYGTTANGGIIPPLNSRPGYGTFFSLSTSGSLSTKFVFNNLNGNGPNAPLVPAPGGGFYGTTASGGTSPSTGCCGTIYQISTSGNEKVLYRFKVVTDGRIPLGIVRGSDGSLYGATQAGGVNDQGTVFKYSAAGIFTVLHSFTGGADGGQPGGSVIFGADGNLYGTTFSGGSAGAGVVYMITPSGTLTTVHSFAADGSEGANPFAPLLLGKDGNFYGTTYYGGTGSPGEGTIFSMTPAGQLTSLYSFTGGSDGGTPEYGLIQATDGSFYGTTPSIHGTSSINYASLGTVFKYTP